LGELGPSIVAITDDVRAVQVSNGIKTYVIKPSPVKVIERTGAGDAFSAGFVAGIMANYPLERAIHLGLEESRAVISHVGAKQNLLRRKLL
jgi:sugar/nucleoside kinase (ribokinase family)